MKLFTRKIIALVSIVLVGILYFCYINTDERKISSDGEILVTTNAKDFHLSTNGIMIFDNSLYILNRDGELIKTVTSKNENLSVFFANNYGFLYDADLNRISQYRDTGEFIRNIKLNDSLFNISYENKSLIFHTKYENGERLLSLGSDGKLKKIYETANAILGYDVKDDLNFAVIELKVETNGYTTNCVVFKNAAKKIYSENSEVGLIVDYKDGVTTLVTNKNLYSFSGEETKKVEIPNSSDALVVDRSIYLLHSGILSKYNSNLEETTKHIVAANVQRLIQVSKSIYGYSSTDVAGNILQRNEFYFRFPSEVEKVEISGIRIATLKNGVVNMYKVSNSRSE